MDLKLPTIQHECWMNRRQKRKKLEERQCRSQELRNCTNRERYHCLQRAWFHQNRAKNYQHGKTEQKRLIWNKHVFVEHYRNIIVSRRKYLYFYGKQNCLTQYFSSFFFYGDLWSPTPAAQMGLQINKGKTKYMVMGST